LIAKRLGGRRVRREELVGAEVALDLVDVAAISRINTWVREATRGKIDGIVDRLSRDVVLVIVNAVYFRGTWDEAFDTKATRDMGFTLLDGTIEPRPMMSRTGTFPYLEGPDFQAIALPYSGKMVSLQVILPDSGSTLAEAVASLSSETWSNWTEQLQPSHGHVALPRFEMSYDLRLDEALQTLGMKQAFDASADFAAMADVRPLFIGEVRHKSRIEVNELGTEAAAATSVVMLREISGSRNAPFVMIVDRPFLFAIRDRITGLVLFRVATPRGGPPRRGRR
jgi:serpin B